MFSSSVIRKYVPFSKFEMLIVLEFVFKICCPKILNKVYPNHEIVKINHLHYIRDKQINEYFEGKNLECLLILLENQNTFININSLDEIFISEFKTSVVTLKKRREQSLKAIKFALSYRLNIPEESIFIQSNDEIDKRIKLIKLNPEVLFEQTDLV